MREGTTIVQNKTGIHARPASIFVQAASKFQSDIKIQAKGLTKNAKSIIQIMSMGLVKGTEITIIADGIDEDAAIEKLIALVDSKLGEC